MSRTPRCHSASITALPIAAGAPIAPLSLRALDAERIARRRRRDEGGAERGKIARARHAVIEKLAVRSWPEARS